MVLNAEHQIHGFGESDDGFGDSLKLGVWGFSVDIGRASSLLVVLSYSVCSSLLTIVNKAAIDVFPFPCLLTGIQYAVCVVALLLMGKFQWIRCDPVVRWESLRRFFPAAALSCMALFTNISLLKHANVDTFIVFRSMSPIFVAISDALFLSEPWPSKFTFSSLLVIFFGAVGYVSTDTAFNLTAYSWAFLYLIVITFDMVYIKQVITNISLNTWELVLYNNFISLLLSPLIWYLSGELTFVADEVERAHLPHVFPRGAVLIVAISCLFGLAISYFGFACRKMVSATSFTVIGVTNKFLTVFFNMLVWSKHGSLVGTLFLLFTMVGGVMYQQSVVRGSPKPMSAKEFKDIEASKLLDKDVQSSSTSAAVDDRGG